RTFSVTASDACGNAVVTPSTVVDTWTEDIAPPTIDSVPSGIAYGCNPPSRRGDADVKGLVSASDNCGGSPTVTVTHLDSGTPCARIRTFSVTASDACGNAVVTPSTVVDTWTEDIAPPTIDSVPSGIAYGCNPPSRRGDADVKGLVSASDNCGGSPTVTVTHLDSGTPCARIRTFSVTASDACGNAVVTPSTVVDTWTEDIAPPTIDSVPSGIAYGCNPPSRRGDADVKGLVSASDNCGGSPTVTVTHLDSGTPCARIRTFSVTASDACGNAVVTPSTVVDTWTDDTAPPTIDSVPSGIAYGCNPPSRRGDADVKGLVSASDNCGGSPTVTVTHLDSGTPCARTRTFSVTASDACGNAVVTPSTVVDTWTEDTAPPTIDSVPSGIAYGCNPPSRRGDAAVKGLVRASDNCGGSPTVTVTHVDSGTPCARIRKFGRSASDACGNAVVTPSTVVDTWTEDTAPPTIDSVPSGIAYGCNPPSRRGDADVKGLVSASDNCGGSPTVTVTHVDSGTPCARIR